MRDAVVRAFLVLLGLAVLGVSGPDWVSAQSPPPPPSPASAPAVPAPALPRFGGDLRIRGEAFDNALDMDDRAEDGYQFTRMRYRLWTEAKPREELKLYFRLGGEYRWGQQGAASIRDPESRLSLDNGWMEIAWPPRSHLTWKLGRQDLTYGEGFLIFDGTPADGSSSAYFDALKLRWQQGPWTVDAFTAKLSDRGFATAARDEDLHGVYAVRALEKATAVEAYALHRFKHQPTVFQAGKPWSIRSPRQQTTAIGGRLSHLPETGEQFATEWAYQFGSYTDYRDDSDGIDADRRAFGGYFRGGAIAPITIRPAFEFGGLYLPGGWHGDEYRGWDGFYSEWPKWSELLIYTVSDGTTRHPSEVEDVGAWTNLFAIWGELRLEPMRGVKTALRGTSMSATDGRGLGGEVSSRGFLFSGRVDLAAPAGANLQLLGERFNPRSFYKPSDDFGNTGRADPAWYARFQITAGF